MKTEMRGENKLNTNCNVYSPSTVCVVDCVMVWVCTQALSIY